MIKQMEMLLTFQFAFETDEAELKNRASSVSSVSKTSSSRFSAEGKGSSHMVDQHRLIYVGFNSFLIVYLYGFNSILIIYTIILS
jgi:hypothetical protein